MQHRPRRTALYLPASNARALEKARSLPADIIILDLEDAVAPDAKPQAREAAVTAVRQGGFGRREVLVRCNGLDTAWGADDLRAIAQAAPDGVLIPKVGRPEDLAAARSQLGDGPPLWAMIETSQAFLNLPSLSATAHAFGLTGLVLGLNDMIKELGARPSAARTALAPLLVQMVVAARGAGLTALDGVCNLLDDPAALTQECEQAAAMGYDGKTLIHPAQIDIANTLFSPPQDEVAFARKIVEAFAEPQNADKGAIRIEGRMAERLHLDQAKRLVAIAEALA